ncbi:MAG TPA: universal stress protein [bacterium]|nr:universal stress protein [bacterium]
MKRKYLVAWDFGPGARAALRQAMALAEDAMVVLAHVVAPGTTPSAVCAVEDELDDEAAVLRELGREVRIRVEIGPVAETLTEILDEEHPDLTLVGMRRADSTRGRLARDLLRATRVPVLAISPDAALSGETPRSIVVGIDFGPAGDAAFDEAARLARRLHAPVRLVHAQPLGEASPSLESHPAASKLEELAARLHGVGIDAAFTVALGDPAKALVAEAHGESSAVIVVGTRDRGAVKRTLLGSVAEKVLATAPGAVLIAKEAAAPEADRRATWSVPVF